MTNDRGSEGAESAARRDAPGRPGLPYAKAFVVHFTAESDVRMERAAGRVEHLQSGRRARFASTAELLACIAALLSDVGHEPPR